MQKQVISLDDEISFDKFEYKKYFKLACRLLPNQHKEKLDIEILDSIICNIKDIVYIFVIDNKIFKIGQSIRNIKQRIQSYNGAKNELSGYTNKNILKMLLEINKAIDVYIFFVPEEKRPKCVLFGQSVSITLSKEAENAILKSFKAKYNKLPIGCKQT